jgi:hypothetical protein
MLQKVAGKPNSVLQKKYMSYRLYLLHAFTFISFYTEWHHTKLMNHVTGLRTVASREEKGNFDILKGPVIINQRSNTEEVTSHFLQLTWLIFKIA